MSKFLSSSLIKRLNDDDSASSVLTQMTYNRMKDNLEDAFYVVDIGDIINKMLLWKSQLPRVEPHYAVKCNDDTTVLSALSRLGAGFDCASKNEIQKVLDIGVAPSRIVYANPCKQSSHIRYAQKKNVPLMTFDNEQELHKVKQFYPHAKLIIRILPPDDTKCQCQLGMKFGTHPKNATKLLKVAKSLNLDVVGVSFHVGSGCYDATAFSAAVALARAVFDMGREVGYTFSLLDIGGGFPGQKSAKISFKEICSSLRPALDTYFPPEMNVRIIAEPGRFFVASAFTLAVNVIAKRANTDGQSDDIMYYVNDGVYGSFNCLLYDHATVEPTLVDPQKYIGMSSVKCSIWGPTCDGLDCIMKECQLPNLEQGDWIKFPDMGAYTLSAASNFNGMNKPKCYYVIADKAWTYLCDMERQYHRSRVMKETRHRCCSMEACNYDQQLPIPIAVELD